MARPNAPDRFNEEKATYVIRGGEGEGDQPDLERGAEAIRSVVRKLPARPGVYRMLDARGDVLYVGKARALKNRVTNYTQVARLPQRLTSELGRTEFDNGRGLCAFHNHVRETTGWRAEATAGTVTTTTPTGTEYRSELRAKNSFGAAEKSRPGAA